MAFTKIVGAGIHTLSNVHTHNVNSSGIITATSFVGPFNGSDGDFSGNVNIDGNLTVQGTTTTLDTTLTEVDKLEVSANNSTVGAAIPQSGTGDILNLYDGATEVFTVTDGGKVGIGTDIPHQLLDVKGNAIFGPIQLAGNPGQNTGIATVRGHFVNAVGDFARLYLSNSVSAGGVIPPNAYISGKRDGIQGSNWSAGLAFHTDYRNPSSNTPIERMVIGSTGNVGIASAIPQKRLDVMGTIQKTRTNGQPQIKLQEDASANGQIVIHNNSNIVKTQLGTAGVSFFATTNVGIGSTIPSQKLDVVGTSNFQGDVQILSGNQIKLLNDANTANVTVDCDGGARFHVKSYSQSVIQAQENWGIKFFQGTGTERFGIEPTGGVVVGAGGTIYMPEYIKHSGDTDTYFGFPNDNQFDISTNGNRRLNVNSDGGFTFNHTNVGTSYNFHGPSSDNNWGGFIKLNSNNNSTVVANIHASTSGMWFAYGGDYEYRLMIKPDGKVGIGTNNPAEEFHLYGNSAVVALVESIGANDSRVRIKAPSNRISYLEFADDDADAGEIRYDHTNNYMGFHVNNNQERLRITSGGNILCGGTAVSQTNRQLVVGSDAEANFAIETHNTSASETANIRFYRSRGTAASPTTLVDGDVLSQQLFYAHDGTDYAHTAAVIRVKCNGTVAPNNVPGEIQFHTNPGSTSANLAMTITKEKHVLFSGLDTYRDTRNVTGITVKSTGGVSFQNYGSNGSRNWRIRPDDMSRWGDLDVSVSPTTNSSTDWPDAPADRVLTFGYDKNVILPNGNLVLGTANKGIDFTVNSHLSGKTEEILNHYEVGTYVPTWTTIASSPSTYRNGIDSGTTSNGLSYVRIGKQVTVTGGAFWSGGSSINNTRPNMSLPFPARIYSVSGTVSHYSLGETEDIHYLNYDAESTLNFFVQAANSGHEAFGDNSDGEMYFNITYMTY